MGLIGSVRPAALPDSPVQLRASSFIHLSLCSAYSPASLAQLHALSVIHLLLLEGLVRVGHAGDLRQPLPLRLRDHASFMLADCTNLWDNQGRSTGPIASCSLWLRIHAPFREGLNGQMHQDYVRQSTTNSLLCLWNRISYTVAEIPPDQDWKENLQVLCAPEIGSSLTVRGYMAPLRSP